jgi:predicted nuclease with RNAse H fold
MAATYGPNVGAMLTVGVDLAASPESTAVARVEWLPGRVVVRDVIRGADDAAVLAAIAQADKAGIDCPLGWPDAFVAFVVAHQAGSVTVPGDIADRAWRRSLTMRLTDLAVREETRLIPLSVSADRIGHVALRCASLLSQLALLGEVVDRSGSGKVVEVYPAASLKIWHLPYRAYKRPRDARVLQELVTKLVAGAPWLELGDFEALCRTRPDAVDAVVAALTARAASRNLTIAPGTQQEASAASTEGWIAIPRLDSDLRDLP